MDTENQASLAFEEDRNIEAPRKAIEASTSTLGGQASTDNSATSERMEAGADYVLARDIQIDPVLHERRAFSEDDLAQAKAVVAQKHLIAPFKVVRRGNSLFLIDGFVTLQAMIALDPDAMVKTVPVDEDHVLAIRLADTRHRRKREPMVPARQALARHRAGVSQEAIAKELGVSAGNVSQMISAAEAEEEFEGLADLLIDRSKISRSLWFDLYTTLERLKKVDESGADGSSSNVDRFRKSVEELVAADEPISADDLRAKLGINGKRSQLKRRNRVLGTPVRRPGLRTKICVDKKRQGWAGHQLPARLSRQGIRRRARRASHFPDESGRGFAAADLTRIGTVAMARMLAKAGHDRPCRARTTSLPLENAYAQIEWLTPPQEDVLARLLLELIGEDELREIFND